MFEPYLISPRVLQIAEFKDTLKRREETLRAAEVKRMEEIRAAHEIQRRKDTERLAEAQKEFLVQMKEERESKAQRAIRSAERKEARLEALRETVS